MPSDVTPDDPVTVYVDLMDRLLGLIERPPTHHLPPASDAEALEQEAWFRLCQTTYVFLQRAVAFHLPSAPHTRPTLH